MYQGEADKEAGLVLQSKETAEINQQLEPDLCSSHAKLQEGSWKLEPPAILWQA